MVLCHVHMLAVPLQAVNFSQRVPVSRSLHESGTAGNNYVAHTAFMMCLAG